MMLLIDTPYHAFQAVTWDKDMEMGYKKDMKNNFECLRVVSNFPGTPTYE